MSDSVTTTPLPLLVSVQSDGGDVYGHWELPQGFVLPDVSTEELECIVNEHLTDIGLKHGREGRFHSVDEIDWQLKGGRTRCRRIIIKTYRDEDVAGIVGALRLLFDPA